MRRVSHLFTDWLPALCLLASGSRHHTRSDTSPSSCAFLSPASFVSSGVPARVCAGAGVSSSAAREANSRRCASFGRVGANCSPHKCTSYNGPYGRQSHRCIRHMWMSSPLCRRHPVCLHFGRRVQRASFLKLPSDRIRWRPLDQPSTTTLKGGGGGGGEREEKRHRQQSSDKKRTARWSAHLARASLLFQLTSASLCLSQRCGRCRQHASHLASSPIPAHRRSLFELLS